MLQRVQTQRIILPPIEDDTEEAPWMVMSMPQWQAINDFYDALHAYGRSLGTRCLVASLLPVRYRPNPSSSRKEKLSPDVMVAFVPDYPRDSYDVEVEGKPPAFVLEVVSRESRTRDTRVKPARYERMGVEEYVLFAPPGTKTGEAPLLAPPLQGYRREPSTEAFVSWFPDESGRLYSGVLGLWLVYDAGTLRAQRPDGSMLLTYDELEAEARRLRAELESRRDSRSPE